MTEHDSSSPTHQQESWIASATGGGVPLRALKTALIVGPVLTLINQGDAIAAGEGFSVLKAALTFVVPYVVATWGAVGAKRAEQKGR